MSQETLAKFFFVLLAIVLCSMTVAAGIADGNWYRASVAGCMLAVAIGLFAAACSGRGK